MQQRSCSSSSLEATLICFAWGGSCCWRQRWCSEGRRGVRQNLSFTCPAECAGVDLWVICKQSKLQGLASIRLWLFLCNMGLFNPSNPTLVNSQSYVVMSTQCTLFSAGREWWGLLLVLASQHPLQNQSLHRPWEACGARCTMDSHLCPCLISADQPHSIAAACKDGAGAMPCGRLARCSSGDVHAHACHAAPSDPPPPTPTSPTPSLPHTHR